MQCGAGGVDIVDAVGKRRTARRGTFHAYVCQVEVCAGRGRILESDASVMIGGVRDEELVFCPVGCCNVDGI